MIRSLRASFLSRALREKLLVVLFIAIALLWWLSAFSTRASAFWRQQQTTTTQLKAQDTTIRNQVQIEDYAKRTAAKLDSSKTLNGNQLAIAVQQLANEAGLRNASTSGASNTRREGQFAIHSVGYVIRNAEWDAIVRFYGALQQRSPYIAVEQFSLSALANNPAQLTLSLRVASMEIVR